MSRLAWKFVEKDENSIPFLKETTNVVSLRKGTEFSSFSTNFPSFYHLENSMKISIVFHEFPVIFKTTVFHSFSTNFDNSHLFPRTFLTFPSNWSHASILFAFRRRTSSNSFKTIHIWFLGVPIPIETWRSSTTSWWDWKILHTWSCRKR